jgi:hypothetical protein
MGPLEPDTQSEQSEHSVIASKYINTRNTKMPNGCSVPVWPRNALFHHLSAVLELRITTTKHNEMDVLYVQTRVQR